jgi:ATP-binding cassette, sub-family E, member 1
MPPKKKAQKRKGNDDDTPDRIAIVDTEKCKPRKCKQECKRNCPVVRMGKICIEVEKTSKLAWISEDLCIGCGICVKKCPMNAVDIINLPKNLSSMTTHRYGPNSFKLHRLPTPRPGQVLGLVGTNGIGKSTALKILAGKLKPNLGRYDDQPEWTEILQYFRGSELQNYFTKILEDRLRPTIKPQYVDHIPRALAKSKIKTVGKIMAKKDERNMREQMCTDLDLNHLQDREVQHLSGGELQRFCIAFTCVQECDVYMFDEPSSYLDVRQRLQAGEAIRALLGKQLNDDGEEEEQTDSDIAADSKYVIVVEHDLAILDYLSDFVCCLYGTPGAYGVCTLPFSVREGINVFLAGYIPTENMRFRNSSLSFKVSTAVADKSADGADEKSTNNEGGEQKTSKGSNDKNSKGGKGKKNKGKKEKEKDTNNNDEEDEDKIVKKGAYRYPRMSKTYKAKKKAGGGQTFKLNVAPGDFKDSEIIVLLGENGCGKTTFIRLLAGVVCPDGADKTDKSTWGGGLGMSISYKPQKIAPKFEGSVAELLAKRITKSMSHPGFQADVMKPLTIDPIMDQKVQSLSGGELQRVAITLALGTPAQIYLIDEPSAYLDSEQRIIASKVIKRFIVNAKRTAFVVEHDFIMATYLADRVVVYTGEPGVECTAERPVSLVAGMNQFLKQLSVSFRRDPTNFRPRINKKNSRLDRDQKASGNYFFMDDE